MARLPEALGLKLLSSFGLPVPRWEVAGSIDEISSAVRKIGLPVVIKAQVPAGRRHQAGGVAFVESCEEIDVAANAVLSADIAGFRPSHAIVQERISIRRELYLAILYDRAGWPVCLVSGHGGTGVEEAGRVCKVEIDPLRGFLDYHARAAWKNAGLSGGELRHASAMAALVWKAFAETQSTMIEVNPLVIGTDGAPLVLSSLIALDEDGASPYRSEAASERRFREETALEREARLVEELEPYRGTARYTELDGDIGLVCGGGGASLAVMDMLREFGLRPANYAEIGGNPSARKVYEFTKIVLRKPIRALLICQNVTNNTQLDEMARGITAALAELGEKRPLVVVRQAGLGEDVARRIYQEAGLVHHGSDWSLEDAVRAVAEGVT